MVDSLRGSSIRIRFKQDAELHQRSLSRQARCGIYSLFYSSFYITLSLNNSNEFSFLVLFINLKKNNE